MWPWEHLAFGYLCYSAYTHAQLGRSPDGRATVILAVGTQSPDLIDKPLAWTFELLPSGHSLGHSLLFALPLLIVVLIAARRLDRVQQGVAFSVGYLSHLPADALYPLAFGDNANLGMLFWPLVPSAASETAGLFSRAAMLFIEFVGYLRSPQGSVYLLAEGMFLLLALLLWLYDGKPGLAVFRTQ